MTVFSQFISCNSCIVLPMIICKLVGSLLLTALNLYVASSSLLAHSYEKSVLLESLARFTSSCSKSRETLSETLFS